MIRSFEAVVFDLDGVITKTALVHALAWKQVFDEYLKSRELKYGEKFIEFTHSADYLPYIDGKPRYDGVASFLGSRNIHIPFGNLTDSPDTETCCGLGNRKNDAFNQILSEKGVELYESTVRLIKQLKVENIKLGVASSSKNCKSVLISAALFEYFDACVDGVVSANLGLKGKPEPDIFLKTCEILGVSKNKTIIVEDAVSGVRAGMKGNFGLVLGVARENNQNELLQNGADYVVKDLAEIDGINGLNLLYQKFSGK